MFAVFLLLTLAGAAPAGAQTAQIIGGGTPTQAWPAQTAISLKPSGTFVCGGTLVSARWVLTAAHCVIGDDGRARGASAFSLRIGSTSTQSGGSSRTVSQVVVHPSYSTPRGVPVNDVALLRLVSTATQEPLRMIASDETSLWAAGTPATIIGWGITESGSPSLGQLREAHAPMVADNSCALSWPQFESASMVCAGGTNLGACKGDSGGPLMVLRGPYHVTVGVTSWGSVDPCAQAGHPAVYARLGAPALASWVRSYVPTLRMTWRTTIPQTGEPQTGVVVTFTAHPSTPPGQSGTPTIAWDTNGDGQFGNGTGLTVSRSFATDGVFKISARATYPDGERTFSRDTIRIRPPSSLTATPATLTIVPPATGSTQIRWTSFVPSRIFVSKDGAPESLFASGQSGVATATVTAPAVYTFRLYEGTTDKNVLLKTLTVRVNAG